jgi:hypothetical protein
MATLLFGPLVTDARGSIRGTTFSRTIGAHTARGRPRPPRPTRSLQHTMQAFLRTAAVAWPIVYPAHKITWSLYGASITLYNRLGVPFHPTGQMVFTRAAVFCELFRSTSVPAVPASAADLAALVPPSPGGLPSMPLASWDINSNDLRLFDWITPPAAATWLIVSVYAPSTTPQASKRFLLTRVLVPANATLPLVIYTDYNLAFPAGTQYHGKLHFSFADDQGRVANPTNQYLAFTK